MGQSVTDCLHNSSTGTGNWEAACEVAVRLCLVRAIALRCLRYWLLRSSKRPRCLQNLETVGAVTVYVSLL